MERPPGIGRTARAVRQEVRAELQEKKPVTRETVFHFDRLMSKIQKAFVEASPEEAQTLERWNSFLSENTRASEVFGEIIGQMRLAVSNVQEGGKKRGIDFEEDLWHLKMQRWIKAIEQDMIVLKVPIEGRREIAYEAQAFMEAAAATMTAEAFLEEIQTFKKREAAAREKPEERNQAIARLNQKLQAEFIYHPEEIEAIVRLALPETPTKKDPEGMKELMEILKRIWVDYGLGRHKGNIARIALGTVIEARFQAIDADTRKDFLKDGRFQLDAYLTYMAVRFADGAFDALSNEARERIKETVTAELNTRLVNSIFFRRFEFSPGVTDADRLELIKTGKRAVETLIRTLFSRIFPTASGVAVGTYLLTRMHPAMALVGLGGIPLVAWADHKADSDTQEQYDAVRKEQKKLDRRIRNMQGEGEVLKTTDAAESISERHLESMNRADAHRIGILTELKQGLMRRFPAVALSATAASVGYALQEMGRMNGQEVLDQMQMMERLHGPVRRMMDLWKTDLKESITAIQRMEEIFEKESDLDPPHGPREQARQPLTVLKNLDITIENLCFRTILRGVTEKIPQGTFALLVGESGSGKSTILRHVTDLLSPEYGNIRIGGVPVSGIRKYGPDSLYAAMAYANQQPHVFADMTVRENILLWVPHLTRTDEEVKTVLRELGLEKFTTRLDEYLKGASGGETLRIGLARALIKYPKILLLDEPSASLDDKTAKEVWGLLERMHKQDPSLTILCVTHSKEFIEAHERAGEKDRRKVIYMDVVNKK